MFVLGFRDAVDEQVLPLLIGCAAILVFGTPYADALGMGSGPRTALDFALWWVWLSSSLLAIWLGSRTLSVPLQDGSARWALTGALHPGWWGVQRVLAATIVCGGFFSVLLGLGIALTEVREGIAALWMLTLAELAILVSLGALIGTVVRPLGTLVCTGSLWLIGHLLGMWVALMEPYPIAHFLPPLLPDLDLLDIQTLIVHGAPIQPARIGIALLWSLLWILTFYTSTVAVLTRRDL